MYQTIAKWFQKKPPQQEPIKLPSRNWREGMWVMHDNRVAILFALSSTVNIHYVDAITGNTISALEVPISSLRQARYLEIPECRRNIPEEVAKGLGYGA